MRGQNILQSMGQNVPGIMENGVTLQQNMKHLYPRAVRFAGSGGIEESSVCRYFKEVHRSGHYSDTDTADIYNHE